MELCNGEKIFEMGTVVFDFTHYKHNTHIEIQIFPLYKISADYLLSVIQTISWSADSSVS